MQTLWTGFHRFLPPQKTDGFHMCIILNPYGFGMDSPLQANNINDNQPKNLACHLLTLKLFQNTSTEMVSYAFDTRAPSVQQPLSSPNDPQTLTLGVL